jgi:hypothetical protein
MEGPAHPLPTPSPVSKLDRRHTSKLENDRQFAGGRERVGAMGGRGAESSGRKKAWSSINHSILSDIPHPLTSISKHTQSQIMKIFGTLWHTAKEIPFMYYFSGNCAASVPISTFICLWAVYIFPGLVHIFPCSRIGRPLLETHIYISHWYKSVGTGRQNIIILFWK